MHAQSAASPETNRAAINKANSQRSTGPKTKAGKARASLNAVKSALTGRTVLLPSDDADTYRQHVNAYIEQFRPVGVLESTLVQSLADNSWRLDRIAVLEMNIYSVGHSTTALTSKSHPTVIEYWIHLKYEKQLRNLHIQESRLRRYRAKDMAELQELQQTRRLAEQADEQGRREAAVELYLAAKSEGQTFRPAEHGFEFSIAQIERFAAARRSPTGIQTHRLRSSDRLAA